MKRMFVRLLVVLSFLALVVVGNVSAQTPFSPKPDDRYKGYPSSLIPKFKTLPDLTICATQKAYEPADTHLMKYTNRVKIARIRIQETDECAGMRTAAGDKWVIRVKGTKVAQDELGRDLFDYGSPTGSICGNARPFSIPVNMPAPLALPPARVTTAPTQPTEPTPRAPRAPRVRPTPTSTPLKDLCPNIVGVQTSVPDDMIVDKNGNCVVPQKASNLSVTVSVGHEVGSGHSIYYDQLPKSGDVPTDYDFSNTFATFRVDEGHGFNVSIGATFQGDTSNITYTDLSGSALVKRRQSDSSQDKWIQARVGYQRPLGPIAVGGFVGWERHGLYETYFEGVDTATVRSYQGIILGAEGTGSTDSDDHKVAVTVSGDYGPRLTRKSWTKQTGFDQVNHADENAKSIGFRAELDVQVYKAVHVAVAFDHLGIDSTRPDTFAASESFSRNALQVIGRVKLGK